LINVNLLPKTLRKRKTLDPYKAVSIAVPALALVVCGFLQFQLMSTTGRLERQNQELQREKAVLQPFLDEQQALTTERAELLEIKTTTDSVRTGRILWSRQLFAMLETLPTPGPRIASRMTFTSLEMRALDEAAKAQILTANTYEGLDAIAEMNVSGVAGSTEVVANYIRELQAAPNFSVVLDTMAQDDSNFYTFNLTIGSGRLERERGATNLGAQTRLAGQGTGQERN
jgi:Tfp pilus assembly protein PilN